MTRRRDPLTVRRTSTHRPPFEGTVSATYLAGIVRFAEDCGAARDALLTGIGLTEDAFEQSDSRLPLEVARTLFDVAAEAVGDPAFALHFGTGVPCATLTLASTLAAATPVTAPSVSVSADAGRTLRDALDGLNRYAPLGIDFGAQSPAQRFHFADGAAGVWLEDRRPDDANGYDWPALTESVFARFATGIRRRGGDAVVRALEVTHTAPRDARHLAAYAQVFRVPVTFGATRNAICLDPAFLERPLEPLPAPVQAVLTSHADAQLHAIRRAASGHASWRARVDALLQALLTPDHAASHAPAGMAAVTIAAVCRTLAVSRHTLHRRLREEGTTFAALHDGARQRVADTLLRTHELPLTVVAARLGFSEPAAFSRAYKRWTGARPSAARATAARATAARLSAIISG